MDQKMSGLFSGEAESMLPSNSSPGDTGAAKTSTTAGGAGTPYVIQPRSALDPKLHLRVTVTVTPIYDTEEKILSNDVSEKIQSMDITRSVESVDGQTLPDELLERIISRIPFPSLFKARALSRSWYFKFPPAFQGISTLRSNFQNHVTAISGNWASYCPMFITANNEIVGFDRTLSRWRRVVTFPYLTEDFNVQIIDVRSCAGPLVSFICNNEALVGCSIVVTNVLTKSTRFVRKSFNSRYFVRLVLEGSHAYKVFAGDPDSLHQDRERSDSSEEWEDDARPGELLVYNSEVRRWTSRQCSTPDGNIYTGAFFKFAAYVDGKLYGVTEAQTCLQIWSYHVEEGTWCLVLDRRDVKCGVGGVGGLVCVGDKVMLALCSNLAKGREKITDEIIETAILYTCPNSIQIFQLDLNTLELTQVSKGPPQVMAWLGEPFAGEASMHISSDAHTLYFGRSNCYHNVVLTFDMRSQEWGSLPTRNSELERTASHGLVTHWIRSFEPGLCPFLMA